MKLIEHPDRFKEGIRILHLLGRAKDSHMNKTHALRISNNKEEFDSNLSKLLSVGVSDLRIYASTSQRDLSKAIRLFKERQLAADFDQRPEHFYSNLQARWISCLSNPKCVLKEDNLWLFDCDTEEELKRYDDLTKWKKEHMYQTKSGWHIIVKPFNLSEHSEGLAAHKNSLMLWAY